MNVSGEDMEEFGDKDSEEFFTECKTMMQDLHLEVQQTANEQVVSDEEEGTEENMHSSEINPFGKGNW